MRSPLQVVRLTPPGRGAVATLLVEGPAAVQAVDARLRLPGGRTLQSRPNDQLVVGRFGQSGPDAGEEVVVRRRSDRSVEVHCHGGLAAVTRIEELLVGLGCQTVGWRDWVVAHHQDPIAAAAHAALAEARTARTAAILLDQYHGALRRAIQAIEAALRTNDTQSAHRQIETLLARAEVGRHLVRPWRVVLAGEANVGKSSLINALVGYPRAIVDRTAGTTRDVVTASTAVDGWPVELSDTAGFFAGGDALDQAGLRRARQKLAEADLAVLVFDAAAPWSRSSRALLDAWPEALVVYNKSDLPSSGGHRPPGLAVSAMTGEGVDALLGALAVRLVPDPPPPGAAVPFTAEHVDQLARY